MKLFIKKEGFGCQVSGVREPRCDAQTFENSYKTSFKFIVGAVCNRD